MKISVSSNGRKKSTGKWVVPFVIFSIFLFTGVAVWLQYKTGIELSPTLITCFYGFCGGELWCLASIKKSKVANSYKELVESETEQDEPKG